ncbi:2-succinyl-5-enolpyruvyl-6-hydroxy-3-cyclohexene-1-carboxylate synthase [Desulfosalsimonas propionicica]|uniref:2-succinyl-5-enolpyruvyl-6-hydroxy-3-cyclohexene-1-carboxylate synthase n=1 Tax=Desulfosalsimonas propionicica TaxID=332175 RepID=A0A7W0HKV9_9BACT|nr:thiamine pyrophosphate-binding protein [Desulfosalsimonas propionicica]MBA2881481.1 2-succinyl-5-enolpyruvyl-6-hydroxy-3-cyclohexene-1-carboxylate synthase [Desulfosalsimonas propionicica]
MTKYYSDEKNVQVILSLLKEHGIKKIIASPGTTNVAFVASVHNDPYFEMYSSVDERSAAYLACGLSSESGEPVVLSCTGATASQNYFSGLIEAYYRKLPILAITSTQPVMKVGHHIAQVTDRSVFPNDAVKLTVSIPIVKDDDDLWDCEIKANKAILELKRHGGGPVHINLPTTYSRNFDTKELPKTRVIKRITSLNDFPELPKGKIAVFVGAHAPMSKEQTDVLNKFCASNNAVVFCDHTSGYKGRYRVQYALAAGQPVLDTATLPDLLIHIGEITGDYYSIKMANKQVWRVSEDGEIRDTFRKLSYVFEMTEQQFFEHYTNKDPEKTEYLDDCKKLLNELKKKISDLPFSNVWLASQIAHLIPDGSTIHFGILNSLRSWNFFELPDSVTSSANVGGFGIDGGVSALIGASFYNRDKLYYGVVGDLAFFYDMNVLGNRDIGKNIRLLLVNNGKGTEFRHFNHKAYQHGDKVDEFIAAAGHFGNKSQTLVKNYAQDLGFEYLSASNKEEFKKVYMHFLTPEVTNQPILFEVFTDSERESGALKKILNIEKDLKEDAKKWTKKVLGPKGISALKKVIRS